MNSSRGLGEPGRRVDIISLCGWIYYRRYHIAGDVQEERRDSVVAPIIQQRRGIQHCGNYKGINVLSHTMKI